MPTGYVLRRKVSTDMRTVGGTAGAVELRGRFPKGEGQVMPSHISVPRAHASLPKKSNTCLSVDTHADPVSSYPTSWCVRRLRYPS